MSAEQHNTRHSPDWTEEADFPPAFQTLGSVIDGFRQLSAEDKSLFMRIFDLQRRSAATVVAGGAGGNPAPAAIVAAPPVSQPAAPVNPVQTTIPVVQGAHASLLASQGLPGYTLDPKSGKTYRVAAKATRTQEFLGLENNALRAKQALDAFMKRHNLRFDRGSNKTVGPSNQEFTPTQEYTALVERLKTANEAVKAYKKAHPEQFRPPQRRGPRPSGVPAGLMAPPQRSGSSSQSGTQTQGSSSQAMPVSRTQGSAGVATTIPLTEIISLVTSGGAGPISAVPAKRA